MKTLKAICKSPLLAIKESIPLWEYLCTYLEENPEIDGDLDNVKDCYPDWDKYDRRPRHDCFLCQYVIDSYGWIGTYNCPYCPVAYSEWGGGEGMGAHCFRPVKRDATELATAERILKGLRLAEKRLEG